MTYFYRKVKIQRRKFSARKGLFATREQNFIEQIAYDGSSRSMKGDFASCLFDYFSGDEKGDGQNHPPVAPSSALLVA